MRLQSKRRICQVNLNISLVLGRYEVRYVNILRWRKLVYNACYNSICAITGTDTSRLRFYEFPIENLVRPLMLEIVAIAKAAGHQLPDSIVEDTIKSQPIQTFFRPSMQQDIEKVSTTLLPSLTVFSISQLS